ncbi:MAG TPA: bifunctional acetate--CoA ligase family protein/GNAT family N-acetyltransferase, partial [Terriglobales bacterium]|nr:bifunctional acetate--CoA ligase family protein/GNAT family N-acetyltransferase [Terriglobales bacterium]
EYFGDDPATKSILIYMESIGDARAFVSAAREVSLNKPIIVIKPGRSEAAAKAASSHTGALTGSDEVLDAAFRRCGVLRVQNIADLFYMAEVLDKQPRPKGNKLTIVTNAGGPAVLATDSLISNGGELTNLSQQTIQQLDECLPSHWSHGNPIDILGDADSARYAKAIEIAANDPNSDGLLVILAPQGMTDASAVALCLNSASNAYEKPVFASWMGGTSVAEGTAALNASGIPTFPYPDTAARAFTYVWRYVENLHELYEIPSATAEISPDILERVRGQFTDIRENDRTILTEVESKKILSLYGIPTVQTQVAHTEDDAVRSSSQIGYPVVLKLFSKTITHKTDVGGVQLNLADENAVRLAFRRIETSVTERVGAGHFDGVSVQPMVRTDGYELILGSSIDSQFGPVILFGSGGQMVEIYCDRALALPPLNTTLAQRLIEQTRIYTALQGVRGRKPVDLMALESLLVRFSQLVLDQPAISEIDINPLVASADGLVALDARIVLYDKKTKLAQVPKPAIRPYPSEYISTWLSDDEEKVTFRPIRPEDEPLMAKFHERLSDRSVYLRYFHSMTLESRVRHERLVRVCFGDYDRELVLVAETHNAVNGPQGIVGVARISRNQGDQDAEIAVIVCDEWQRSGLGSELLKRIVQIAKREKIRVINAEVLRDNVGMQTIMKRTGFRLKLIDSSGSMRATLDLADGLRA